MKKTDLLKPGGARGYQLTRLAKQINDREDVIAQTMDQVRDKSSSAICEVSLQGQSLLEAKEIVGHGNFYPWLASHCPLISPRMSARYMRVASNRTRVSELGATSLRQALQLCADNDAQENGNGNGAVSGNGSPKTWPHDVEALGRFAKFTGYVERHPLATWSGPTLDKLRDSLAPYALFLWPEKFS